MRVLNDKDYNSSYKSLYIPDKKLQINIWSSANKKQKSKLNQLWRQEKDNPVNAIFFSKFGFLQARLMCTKFIVNFKEYHKQIPLFESKFAFINRVANVIKDYNERLKNAQLNKTTNY